MTAVLPSNIALVAAPEDVPASDLTATAAALQVQATRDFAPLWGVSATVDAFTKAEDVPIGHWSIIVKADIGTDDRIEGYHTDPNNQPVAMVKLADNWTLVASHEMIEMLVDPFGNRLVPGPSVDPDPARSADRVQYLLEACDPVQDARFAYTVNGIAVSDFITPQFHDPAGTAGARYDFKGAIDQPRRVLANGYISWHDPVTGGWFQLSVDGTGRPSVADLGPLNVPGTSAREFVHASSPRQSQHRPEIDPPQLQAIRALREHDRAASKAHADRLQGYLARLRSDRQAIVHPGG